MRYWCEIRTQGINDAMTRVTGEINTVHRGIFEGATLFDFLRRIAALQPARPEHLDIAAEPTAIIQGPHGEFRVYPTGGALRLEGHREDISALTATIRVAGLLQSTISNAAAA